MDSEVAAVCLSIVIVQAAIGSLANGFVVIVNIRDLVSQGSLGSCDSILTFLAISRILFQWFIVSFYSIMKDFYTQSFSLWVCRFLLEVMCFLHNMCLWFATWLSVLYCVRVVSISGRIFSTLKRHFDDRLPMLIAGSLVISSLSNVIFYFSNENILVTDSRRFIINTTDYGRLERSGRVFPTQEMANNSNSVINNNSQTINFILRYILSSLPPFLVFCVAAGLLVYTLWKHTRRMKTREKTSFREPSLRAVHAVIQNMGVFFLFYLFYLVGFNVFLSGIMNNKYVYYLCTVVIGAYPSIHSGFLVLGNSKLRAVFMDLMRRSRCKLSMIPMQMLEDPDANTAIETVTGTMIYN